MPTRQKYMRNSSVYQKAINARESLVHSLSYDSTYNYRSMVPVAVVDIHHRDVDLQNDNIDICFDSENPINGQWKYCLGILPQEILEQGIRMPDNSAMLILYSFVGFLKSISCIVELTNIYHALLLGNRQLCTPTQMSLL